MNAYGNDYSNADNAYASEAWSATPAARRRLHRSATDKYVAGVLGGVAETYGIDSTLVRVLFLLSFLLPGPQVLLYFVMWFVMPRG